MRLSDRLSANVLKKLIKGTFLATLLLAAQEGGKPLNEAAWILVGAALTTVVDAYATHLYPSLPSHLRQRAGLSRQPVGGHQGRFAAHLRQLPHGRASGVRVDV